MASFIPKLARISSRSRPGMKNGSGKNGNGAARPARALPAPAARDGEYLAGLVPVVRRRAAIAPSFSDAAILASLTSIAARSTDERRWKAAQASTLGQCLSGSARDLQEALVIILSLLPRPRA